jgi:hypothetical protein
MSEREKGHPESEAEEKTSAAAWNREGKSHSDEPREGTIKHYPVDATSLGQARTD